MKIAYVTSPFLSDSDLPLLHELQQLADVTYIIQIGEKTKSRMFIDVKKLKSRGGVYPATSYPELQNLSRYVDLGKTYVVNMPGRHDWSPQNLWAALCLVAFIVRHRFNIVHLLWPPRYGTFPLYLLRRRLILTLHDPLPHSSEDTRLNRFHRRVAMRLVPRFILLNRSQQQQFIDFYGIDPSRIETACLGIYTHLAEVSDPLAQGIEDLGNQNPRWAETGYILFVGTINTHKGVDYLCEAMRQVHKAYPDVKLVVAGSGKLYFDTQPYVDEGLLQVHNRYLSNAELVSFITNARCVVCPYIDATQSGVIMSAFAFGKPVIATSVGALPEMVEDGRHGLIVPPKDSDALAMAICCLCDSPAMLKQMHDNILADYQSGERSWNSIAKKYVDIYTRAQ